MNQAWDWESWEGDEAVNPKKSGGLLFFIALRAFAIQDRSEGIRDTGSLKGHSRYRMTTVGGNTVEVQEELWIATD
jgi:hypothetical protein